MDAATQALPEQKFAEMMAGAIQGSMQAEAGLRNLLGQEQGQNGKGQVIHVPGQKPIVLNGASDRQLILAGLQFLGFVLQTTRIIAVALNDLDTRLRLLEGRRAESEPAPAVDILTEGDRTANP
jgi:hypothetical protein